MTRLRVEERTYSDGLARGESKTVEVTVFDGADEVASITVTRVIASLQHERRYEVKEQHRRADMDGEGEEPAPCWSVGQTETAILPMPPDPARAAEVIGEILDHEPGKIPARRHQEDDRP